MNIDTVILLGAGASHDYDVPIGSGLRKALLDPLLAMPIARLQYASDYPDHDVPSPHRTHRLDALIDQFRAFQSDFKVAEVDTIDRFLSYPSNQRHGPAARIAIAHVLLAKEKEGLRVDGVNGASSVLADLLQDHVDDLSESPFRIVTFNYERVIQARVAASLSVRYGHLQPDALLDGVRCLCSHVYGGFSTPLVHNPEARRFVHADRTYRRPFGKELPPREYIAASKDIRIIGQERTALEENHVASMRAQLQAAKRVIFLGFGFDSTNLQLLGLDRGPKALGKKAYVATCKGLGEKTKRQANALIQTAIDFREVSCRDLLRDILL